MQNYGEKFYSEVSFKDKNKFNSIISILKGELLKAQSLAGYYDVFLSHSSRDKSVVINFKAYLEQNYRVYVDWIDNSDIGRDSITGLLKIAMNKSRVLLYLHTQNSIKSKWVPWEIGYFDSLKGSKKVGVMPLLNESGQIASYTGLEYLKIYTQLGADKLDHFLKFN